MFSHNADHNCPPFSTCLPTLLATHAARTPQRKSKNEFTRYIHDPGCKQHLLNEKASIDSRYAGWLAVNDENERGDGRASPPAECGGSRPRQNRKLQRQLLHLP